MNEVIILSPHDELTEKIEQMLTEIRQIPFLDSNEYYSIIMKINYIIDYVLDLDINKNSHEFTELKLKIKGLIFDEV